MDKLLYILSIVILLFGFFYIYNKNKKLIKEKELTLEQLWEKEKFKFEEERKELIKSYNSEKEHFSLERQNILESIYKEKIDGQKELNILQQQIKEKENFNNSLLKIREEELDRIIEEKKKKEEAALNYQLEKEREEKISVLNAEFLHFQTEQQKMRDKVLQDIDQYKKELEDFRLQRESINRAIALENAEEEEKNKHRIFLTVQDKEDIQYLLSIEEKINNKQLLRKLIWSEYLQKPLNEMLKRLFLGNPPKNVIYCIENINNHKKYIGKTSAEVSKRWTEHIKTSLDIGTIKSQNIHKALYGHWDDFTFSIITETEKEKISSDEKYYVKLFESDIYGYNMKGGG